MIVERDVPVRVSDGNILRVNVFCPPSVAPVVMSMTPYGKENPTASACRWRAAVSRCQPTFSSRNSIVMTSALLIPKAPLSPDVLSIPAKIVEPTENQPFR